MTDEELLRNIRSIFREEMKSQPKEFLTVREAAELTRFSKGTIYNMVNERKIPFIKPEGKLLFVYNDLVEWLTSKAKAPISDERINLGGKSVSIK